MHGLSWAKCTHLWPLNDDHFFSYLLAHRSTAASPKVAEAEENDIEAQQQGETFDEGVDSMKNVVIVLAVCLGLALLCLLAFVVLFVKYYRKTSVLACNNCRHDMIAASASTTFMQNVDESNGQVPEAASYTIKDQGESNGL